MYFFGGVYIEQYNVSKVYQFTRSVVSYKYLDRLLHEGLVRGWYRKENGYEEMEAGGNDIRPFPGI